MPSAAPEYSIVVPAYNEEAYLPATLAAAREGDIPRATFQILKPSGNYYGASFPVTTSTGSTPASVRSSSTATPSGDETGSNGHWGASLPARLRYWSEPRWWPKGTTFRASR